MFDLIMELIKMKYLDLNGTLFHWNNNKHYVTICIGMHFMIIQTSHVRTLKIYGFYVLILPATSVYKMLLILSYERVFLTDSTNIGLQCTFIKGPTFGFRIDVEKQ